MKNTKKNTLFLISNMYPSRANVRYGIFVKNFKNAVNKDWQVKKTVLVKKSDNVSKLIAYGIFYLKIFKTLFKAKPKDLIYVHFPLYAAPALFPLCFLKKKLVLNFHGNDLVIDRIQRQFFNLFQKCLVKKASLIITPSAYYAKKVANTYQINPKKIKVYPSGGIDTGIFKPVSSNNNKYFTISYVSSFIEEKGWRYFLEAVKTLKEQNSIPELQVIMVGDGPGKKLIEDFNSQNNLGIKIYTGLSHPQIAKVYQQSDLFIFPTVLRGESLGLVGLEAMACGTPVIGSDWEALKTYLIDEYNGYLFKPTDSSDLFDKIIKYYKLPEKQKVLLQQNALNTALQFEKHRVNKTLLNLLHSL